MPTVADRIAEGNDYVARHVYALEADTVRQLYEAHLAAFRELQRQVSDMFARLDVNEWSVQDIAAREALMQRIALALREMDDENARFILDRMVEGFQAGYYGNGWILDSGIFPALGTNPAFIPVLPTEAIRAQVLAPYVGKTFGERFADNRAQFELNIKNALVQSQIQGDTIRQAQQRIADNLGIEIGRRTKADRARNSGMFARTEMIARTELLRASNLGAMAMYEANQDVLKGWEWKTALDDRVCPICAPLDGNRYVFGDRRQQPPPAHPRCRCAVLPVLINQRVEQAIVGERVTFMQWAAQRGLTENQYGQAFNRRGQKAPQKPVAA